MLSHLKGVPIGRNSIVKNSENFSERNAKTFVQKFLTVTEKSSKNRKKIDRLLIGQKFYDIRDHFAQSPSTGFKWEIRCTVPKNNNKNDVRC